MNKIWRTFIGYSLVFLLVCMTVNSFAFLSKEQKETRREKETEELQERFKWWPTDATPGPVKDPDKGGYWWWPTKPGKVGPLWGNRGWVYVYKIIFDYKEEELPPPKPEEPRPSLLIKKIIKNIKVYFDFDKSDLREDATKILNEAIGTLRRNPESSILITGNCDIRGSETYNIKLGKQRGEAVRQFMIARNIPENRILIISRGKLDAIAPITDIVGMQKDRNAQFMIAEVEEVMIPYPKDLENIEATPIEEGKYFIEEKEDVESAIKVSTREYVVKKGDTLSGIAAEEYGGAHRWKYLYELNKDVIKDPNKLKEGQKIIIPIE